MKNLVQRENEIESQFSVNFIVCMMCEINLSIIWSTLRRHAVPLTTFLRTNMSRKGEKKTKLVRLTYVSKIFLNEKGR